MRKINKDCFECFKDPKYFGNPRVVNKKTFKMVKKAIKRFSTRNHRRLKSQVLKS